MATNDDIEYVLSASDTFRNVPKISYSSPIEDITRALAEYCGSGVPCVITGLQAGEDDEQSPFFQSTKWVESIYAIRGRSFRCFRDDPPKIPQLPTRRPTPTLLRAPTTPQVGPSLAKWRASLTVQPYRTDSPMPSRMGRLATRFLHCA